jgi:CDP-2,3-bis-(O-geranylgeranyl)-sn-glycerol synthase
MVHDILFSLWFLLPAAAANVAPILSKVVPLLSRWDLPLDFGRSFRGKELFGTHKTWRGLVCGIVAATLVFWLQHIAISHFGWARSFSLPSLILGPLFGLGALGGDAIESFFKRQRGIKSGKSWIFFDQLDYIIGGVLVSLPFVILKPMQYVWILILWFLIHLITSYLGWMVGLKEGPI